MDSPPCLPLGRSKMPNPPRLRDSCTGCAASKVRCSKDKPTCARCDRRQLKCEYIVTRRTGRISSRLLRAPCKSPVALASREDCPIDGPSPPDSTFSDAAAYMASPQSNVYGIQDHMYSTWDTFWDGDGASPPNNDAWLSPSYSPEMRPSYDENGLQIQYLDSLMSPTDAHFSVNASVPESNGQFVPPVAGMIGYAGDPDSPGSRPIDPINCCVGNALSCFTRLVYSANAQSQCGLQTGTSKLAVVQGIIAENKQILDSVSSMLDCTCSQDHYLIAIISLVLFKVIGRYSAATKTGPAQDDASNRMNQLPGYLNGITAHYNLNFPAQLQSTPQLNYQVENDHENRIAAQCILSELHRAQQVVNLFSHRSKSARRLSDSSSVSISSAGSSTDLESHSAGVSQLPYSTFDQLETDLQKCLRDLSVETIEYLRRD